MKSDVSSFVRRVIVAAAVLLLISPATTRGQSVVTEKLDPVVQALSRQLTGRSRVIVQFHGEPDVRVITDRRGVAGRQLAGVSAQVADLDNTELATVAVHPKVSRIAIDRPAFRTLERTGAALGATLAREEFGVTGKGIGVAVIDSGITAWHNDLYLTRERSPRLSQGVAHFKDFTREISPRLSTTELPSDDYGHGTHVAGIIAGNGFDSGGARTGVAPDATLIGLKVLDADGHGYVSDVIAAIDYAIAVKDVYNIRVMNVSVASGVFESYNTDPLAQAALRAVQAGIVVVAAAGNLGTDESGEARLGGVTCPGNAPWVLTVGAASHGGTQRRSDDTLARFSSRGPTRIDHAAKPDLLAYGVGIESLSDPNSTLHSTYADYLLDGTRRNAYKAYLSLSGTSMAAPQVTATVALMLETNPSLTPNAVKAILEYTAEERAGESFFAQGAGLLNTQGAVRMAAYFEAPQKGFPEPRDLIADEWIAWSQEIVWGNDRISGGLILPGSNAWAPTVSWGAESTTNGRPIVWGVEFDDSIVWSTADDDSIVWSTTDGDSIVWSTTDDDSIVWSTAGDDSIVWSTADDDSIVWSTTYDDSIVWSTSNDDSIVWSTGDDDSIVWSTGTPGQILWPPPVDNRRRDRPGGN